MSCCVPAGFFAVRCKQRVLITSEHPLCLTGKSLGKPVAMRGFRKRSSNFCVVKGRGFSSDLRSRVWRRTCTAGIGGRSASKRWEEPSQKTCRGVYLRFKGGFGSARAQARSGTQGFGEDLQRRRVGRNAGNSGEMIFHKTRKCFVL